MVVSVIESLGPVMGAYLQEDGCLLVRVGDDAKDKFVVGRACSRLEHLEEVDRLGGTVVRWALVYTALRRLAYFVMCRD